MKKLPIGIQTFKDIRDKKENYVYVDKTDQALKLIETGRYYFLSRPRRFGKSLFLDTLHNIFEGNKSCFEGLFIYDKWDWNVSYPVIKISFGTGIIQDSADLNRRIKHILEENQEYLDIKCKETDYVRECFKDMIKMLYKKYQQKVVILIDEYDKPILDSITRIENAKEIREGLKDFYSVIKDSDQYMKFAFLTGVSKFSKVSIFSGLNNLKDITLSKQYATICGYTQQDIETTFQEHLEGVDLNKVKHWYNGYNFLGELVYNPFDILLFISEDCLYRSYWFETGSPSFLINLIKEKHYFIPSLEHIEADDKLIGSFDIENISIETLLFQTGYLTIKEVYDFDEGLFFSLGFPNKEVRMSLNNYLLDYFEDGILATQTSNKMNLYKALRSGDPEKLEQTLKSLFASIPYNNFTGTKLYEYEGYYASVIYSYLAATGIELIAEDVTNKGRIDLTLRVNGHTYILEFKVLEKNEKTGSAMEQIKDKKYYEKYQTESVYLIGIEFCQTDRNIKHFEWEKKQLS